MVDPESSPRMTCVPEAIPPSERVPHFALLSRLFPHEVVERVRLPSGYRYRFRREETENLEMLVTNERKCCPFLELSVTPEPSGEGVWLTVVGPPDVHDLLSIELPYQGGSDAGTDDG